MKNLKDLYSKIRGTEIKQYIEVLPSEYELIVDNKLICQTPLVSIVVATYNQAEFIRKTLDSLLEQKCNFEYEILIGEDCSTDNTRQICIEYQKKHPNKIKLFLPFKNLQGRNGTFLRNQARGEFVAICEGDDYWIDIEKLQIQADILIGNNDVSMVCSDVYLTYGTENNPTEGPTIHQSMSIPYGKINKKNIKHYLNNFGIFNVPSIMYRKSMLEKTLYLDISSWVLSLGDITLFYRLSCVGNFYYINKRTAVYRISGKGISRNKKTIYQINIDAALIRLFFSNTTKARIHTSIEYVFIIIRRLHKLIDEKNKKYFNDAFKLYLKCVTNIWFYYPIVQIILLLFLFKQKELGLKSLRLLKIRWRIQKRICPKFLWK